LSAFCSGNGVARSNGKRDKSEDSVEGNENKTDLGVEGIRDRNADDRERGSRSSNGKAGCSYLEAGLMCGLTGLKMKRIQKLHTGE